jgi:hypothetical protein
LVDTSISFQFDLATPPQGQPRTAEAVPSPIAARRMIDAPPIPAKPIASLPAGQQFPISFAPVSLPKVAKKQRTWGVVTLMALGAVVVGGLIAIVVQLTRN